MKEQNKGETAFYQRLIEFTEDNKKTLIIVGVAVLLIAAGATLYNKYMLTPKKKESQEVLAKIQDYFGQDSFNLVINGGLGLKSAVQISSEYSGTKAGNLANYYAGVSYLKTGDYDNAIKYLKKFNPNNDKIIGSLALSCIGDAYIEKSDFREGLNYYNKALAYTVNELTTPIHARKALNVYIELKDFESGLKLANKLLKDKDIPDAFKNELKKYKGLLEAKSGKYNPDGNA